MAGVVLVPWYATLFRGDKFEVALQEIAPVALRYGGTDFHVYRSRDDPYRFMQFSTFEEKMDWERFWYGEEFVAWRADYSSWYQVPVVYTWTDLILAGSLDTQETTSSGAGDGIG
jgi:hypothetical protein